MRLPRASDTALYRSLAPNTDLVGGRGGCLAADYQRSLSVPISILVEDTDSYSGSIDLSYSLDLRRHQPLRGADDYSGSPPSTCSLLS